MVCQPNSAAHYSKDHDVACSRFRPILCLARLVLASLFFAALVQGKTQAQVSGQTNDWRQDVRRYCEARDWISAMRLVDQEIVRVPGDMDVREWRARVFLWSGHLREAEQEYLAILRISRNDPDKWLGLSNV